jgi:hypothetical protein
VAVTVTCAPTSYFLGSDSLPWSSVVPPIRVTALPFESTPSEVAQLANSSPALTNMTTAVAK